MIDESSKSTSEKLLYLLKTKGSLTAATLAESLGITSMGARQHLENLTASGLIEFRDIKQGRGRPARFWSITTKSDDLFPDTHQELTVQLLDAIEEVYGEEGVNKIIDARQSKLTENYQQQINDSSSLKAKLENIVTLRTREGYMASLEEERDHFVLRENHCPICIAASKNPNFCQAELSLLQNVVGDQHIVKRTEHIIKNDRCCSYIISSN